MAKRKINPLGLEDPGYVPKPKKHKKKKPQTKKQREAGIRKENYRTRVKRMRGLFGDQFKAKDGYDIRKINSWTPAQKAKITKYFRVIAPRITGDFVVKRYRRQDSIDAAVEASLQEKRLKGQTGVAFSIDPGDKIEVKVRKGKATVVRNGLQRAKLAFDKQAFLEDPDREIDRVLAESNANVFRVLVGGQEQNKTLTRSMVKDEIFKLIRDYSPANIQRDQDQRPFDEWLNGLVAYPGTEKRTFSGVERFIKKHERTVAKREIARLNKLSIDHGGKGYKATIDKQINIRRKRKGLPPLTKRARAKGRR